MDQTIDALRALPGIKDVSIRRVWPDKLLVVLESETAFARTKNPYWLINPDGLLFESQKKLKEQLPIFIAPSKQLPRVVEFYKSVRPILKSATLITTKIQLLDTGDWEVFVTH